MTLEQEGGGGGERILEEEEEEGNIYGPALHIEGSGSASVNQGRRGAVQGMSHSHPQPLCIQGGSGAGDVITKDFK